MNTYDNLAELIGDTPLVKLRKLSEETGANIYGKLEYFNPGLSVKDRIAKSMIEEAEKIGEIDEDTVIIEPTSGNTGIGLAMVAAIKGYKLILTMPESMSVERRKIMKAHGAEIVLTPAGGGMGGAIDKADELAEKYDNTFIPQQFKNPANPLAHKRNTGVEIWNDMDGNIDIFVAGVGTGGTITGVSQTLKEKDENIQSVAVEPEDSAVLSGEESGGHKIQGIGAGFIPEILDTSLIDEVVKVSNEESFETTRRLAKEEGLLIGISCGAAASAALKIAQKPENRDKNIVVILPDTGTRYLSNKELF